MSLDTPSPVDPAARAPTERAELLGPRVRLVALSFLMLFLELALIRWTGANVVYLSYFSNFVLLGSFLGIGLGFLRAGRRGSLFPWTPVALLGLVAFIRIFPADIVNSGSQLIFLGKLHESGPPRWVSLSVIFVVVAAVMAFVGEGVARTFARFEPLEAYKLDLIGSVLGICGFVALAFLRAPPLAWGVVVAIVLTVVFLPVRNVRFAAIQALALIGVLLFLGVESFESGTHWSPYYKVQTHSVAYTTPDGTGYSALAIDVNGVPHQAHLRASDNPLYALVYERAKPRALDNVLVIGAGGGNDVAVALARHAKHVDAVEIDPVLYELGRDHHPNHPYQDPRVSIHIGDGRAFLERSDKKYDLILFALPDSITLVQGQSSLRLESYLFTKQAVEAARDHLTPTGAFAMYNYYRESWLVDRYANTIRQAFKLDPCVTSITAADAGNLAVMVGSRNARTLACTAGERWSKADAPPPATDDHPFPYLRTRTLPDFYVITIFSILAISLIAVRGVAGPIRPMLRFIDLFFMGAAFLLLETKSIVQFALLFGTTWFVNALVFLGVLLSVLAAVAVSRRVTFRRPARLYAVLLASLVVAWLVPPSWLLTLSPVLRFVVAATVAFLPIFTANLVFTQRFKDTSSSTQAFGANLLGAMFGGLLEYAALVVGYRSLLIGVAVLYGFAFLFGRRHLGPGSVAPMTEAGVATPVGGSS